MREGMRNALRRAGWGAVIALLLVCASLVLLFTLPSLRRVALDRALVFANANTDYRIAIVHADRIDPWGVELRQVAVRDVHDTFSIKAGAISLRLSPLALFRGELRVRSLSIARVRGHFHQRATPDEDTAASPSADDEEGLRVHLERLSVRDAELLTSGLGPVTLVQVRALDGSGEWSQRPWAYLARAELGVDSAQGSLLRLSTQESRWDPGLGAKVVLEGSLVDAPLRLTARMLPAREGDLWPRGNLRFDVDGLSPRSWAALGLEATPLAGPLTLSLTAASTGASAEGDLTLSVRTARLQLHAFALTDLVMLRLDIAVPDASQVISTLPKLDLSGRLTATSGDAADRTRWALTWEDLVADGTAWPSGQLVVDLDLPTLRVETLTLDDFGEALVLRGMWNTDLAQGEADVDVRDLSLSRWQMSGPRPLRGGLDGRLHLSRSATGALSGGGTLRARTLVVGGVAARAGDVEVHLSGTDESPELALKADATDLTVSDVRMQQATLRLNGNLTRADARLSLRGPDGWLRAEARAEGLQADRLRLALTGRALWRERPLTWVLQASRHQPSARTELVLSATSGEQRLKAVATVEGDERGRTHLELSNLALPGAPPIHATLDASGSLESGALSAHVNAWCESKAATLVADLALQAPRARDGSFDYARAEQQTHLDAHIPLPLLTASAGDKFAGLRGSVDVSADLGGTVAEPQGDASVVTRVSLAAQPDLPPETLSATVHADKTGARLRAKVVDLEGELLTLTGAVDWSTHGMASTFNALNARALPPVQVHARLADRRLDTMQGVVAYVSGIHDMALPLQVGAEVGIDVVDGVVDGSVRARATLRGDKLDASCALGTQTAMSLVVDMKGGDINTRLKAQTLQGGSLDVTAHTRLLMGAEAPLDKLLKEVELKATARDISLATLPGLCELEGGTLAFELEGKGLGSEPNQAELRLRVKDMRAHGGAPVSTELTARLLGDALRAEGTLRAESKQVGIFQMQVPLKSDGGPALALDRPISATLRLTEVPLGPFLSFGDAMGNPKGTVSGQLRLSGTLTNPQPDGVIELRGVAFSLAAIAQPLRDINGRVSLRGRTLRIQGLTARDRDGKLRLDGQLSLRANGGGAADLSLAIDKFPLRRQGDVLGELTTQIRARATMDAKQQIMTDVTVDGGRLWLTGERGRRVQSLAKNSEVRFVDEPEQEVVTKKTKLSASLASLQAKTKRDFWVMHKDFSVQVALDVALTHDEAFELTGAATLVRGELQLLGKSFRIEKGAIRFTGDFPPDPELELHALFKPPAGEELRVEVSGRASAPVLAFSGAATNAGEAVAVLSGSNRAGAETEAQTDARNFAAGLTAGLLSMTVREEYGDWVPIVSVENDETGAPARGRAAFDASKLIPGFLRGIARGAYVEGVVGSSGQTGGSVGLGARIEVVLPHDFVTSAGYGPGSTWGADFAWAP